MRGATPIQKIYSNPHKALYGVAPPRRIPDTVFGGAPCTELCAYRYTYTLSAQVYVKIPLPQWGGLSIAAADVDFARWVKAYSTTVKKHLKKAHYKKTGAPPELPRILFRRGHRKR